LKSQAIHFSIKVPVYCYLPESCAEFPKHYIQEIPVGPATGQKRAGMRVLIADDHEITKLCVMAFAIFSRLASPLKQLSKL